MNKDYAREYGIQRGLAAARYCVVDPLDHRDAGCPCFGCLWALILLPAVISWVR